MCIRDRSKLIVIALPTGGVKVILSVVLCASTPALGSAYAKLLLENPAGKVPVEDNTILRLLLWTSTAAAVAVTTLVATVELQLALAVVNVLFQKLL